MESTSNAKSLHLIQKKKKTIFIPLILSAASLSAGIMIYILFRVRSLRIFSWLKMLHLDFHSEVKPFETESPFFSFFVYSLPDGLWALSAFLLLGTVLKENKKLFYFYSFIFLCLSIFFELAQLSGLIAGTFDFMDIFVILLAYFLGITLYKIFFKEDSYES